MAYRAVAIIFLWALSILHQLYPNQPLVDALSNLAKAYESLTATLDNKPEQQSPRDKSTLNPFIQQFKEWYEKNIKNPQITDEDWATSINTAYSTLYQYVQELKIQQVFNYVLDKNNIKEHFMAIYVGNSDSTNIVSTIQDYLGDNKNQKDLIVNINSLLADLEKNVLSSFQPITQHTILGHLLALLFIRSVQISIKPELYIDFESLFNSVQDIARAADYLKEGDPDRDQVTALKTAFMEAIGVQKGVTYEDFLNRLILPLKGHNIEIINALNEQAIAKIVIPNLAGYTTALAQWKKKLEQITAVKKALDEATNATQLLKIMKKYEADSEGKQYFLTSRYDTYEQDIKDLLTNLIKGGEVTILQGYKTKYFGSSGKLHVLENDLIGKKIIQLIDEDIQRKTNPKN